ncbi:MAG TPA: DNA-binding protein [Clostridiales bacterium]|nr:DNA-binding protein [Clostridiales bacterium]HCI64721.1 DNA-binding protein [Clostridiales bacterium]
MDALEMTLLLDYYGGMLTRKQRDCFDMRHNQDLSLGEIGEALGVSRQAVCDNLTRTEALLRRMEENIGCVRRDRVVRNAAQEILTAAEKLEHSSDPETVGLARQIVAATQALKE